MTEQLHHVQGQIPITGVKQIPTVQTPVRGSTIRVRAGQRQRSDEERGSAAEGARHALC